MNKEEILKEIEKTKEHLANMEQMLRRYKCERWKPEPNEEYYYVSQVSAISRAVNDEFDINTARYKAYNCFRTKEEAKREAEKILVRRMLEDIAKRLNKGNKIDWTSESPRKYHLCIDKCDYIFSNVCYSTKYQGTVYCLDKSFRDIAIQEIGEERLKKYLRGE